MSQRIEINQQKNRAVCYNCHDDRGERNRESISYRYFYQLCKSELCQLGNPYAGNESAEYRDCPCKQRFEEQYPSQVESVHPQNAVKTELLLSAFDQRCLCIKEKQKPEQRHYICAHLHHIGSSVPARHAVHDP